MEIDKSKHIATTVVTRFLLNMLAVSFLILGLAHLYVNKYRSPEAPKTTKEFLLQNDSIKN